MQLRRKGISNDVSNKHRLTLIKSTTKHKALGKNWSIKRKLDAFKKDYVRFRDSNASKIKLNKHCDANGLEDHKVDVKKLDTSKKINPNDSFLQVFCDCNVAFEQHFQYLFHYLFSH